jgi:hypothetical protein
MTVYGISQSSGVERLVTVERGGEGIVLTFSDLVSSIERARIMLAPDRLLATITDPPDGGCTIAGTVPPHGTTQFLDVEIRRNEVLLRVHAEAETGWDAAVGLDDFQDALEKAIG